MYHPPLPIRLRLTSLLFKLVLLSFLDVFVSCRYFATTRYDVSGYPTLVFMKDGTNGDHYPYEGACVTKVFAKRIYIYIYIYKTSAVVVSSLDTNTSPLQGNMCLLFFLMISIVPQGKKRPDLRLHPFYFAIGGRLAANFVDHMKDVESGAWKPPIVRHCPASI